MTLSFLPGFEQAYAGLPADGWLTYNEAQLLWRAALLAEGTILEVGSYMGRSTCLLAQFGRQVLAVDPFDNFHDELSGDYIHATLLTNLRSRGIKNVQVFRERIEDWLPHPVELAYLDGDHTYTGTIAQIQKAQACNPACILIHDVNDSGGGLEVKKAALELLGMWEERVERLAYWRL